MNYVAWLCGNNSKLWQQVLDTGKETKLHFEQCIIAFCVSNMINIIRHRVTMKWDFISLHGQNWSQYELIKLLFIQDILFNYTLQVIVAKEACRKCIM